jgi:hypothetical protein
MDAHGDHAHQLQRAVALVVAGEPAEQVAQHPGDQRRDDQQPGGPGQSPADQRRDGCREGGQRRPEIAAQHPAPEGEVLLAESSRQPVELLQRGAHRRDRLRGRAAEGGHRRDRLLNRIDRRGMRDHEGQIDADEDHQGELDQAFREIGWVRAHAILKAAPCRGRCGAAGWRLSWEGGELPRGAAAPFTSLASGARTCSGNCPSS